MIAINLIHCLSSSGKTLCVVTFTLTLLSNPLITELRYSPTAPKPAVTVPNQEKLTDQVRPRKLIQSVLVIVPVITIENWKNEYQRWCKGLKSFVNLTVLRTSKKAAGKNQLSERLNVVKKWWKEGGVLIMGNSLFRSLTKRADKTSLEKNKSDCFTEEMFKYLINPGDPINLHSLHCSLIAFISQTIQDPN